MKNVLKRQQTNPPAASAASAYLTLPQEQPCRRIEHHQETIQEAIRLAGEQQDHRGLASLLSVDCKRVELLGRLTGALQEGRMRPATSLPVVVMLPEHQQDASIATTYDHPEST